MKKFFAFLGRIFNHLIVISALIIIAALAFMYTYPFNVAEIKKINILNEVRSGSTIKYNVDYCRNVGKGVETYTRRFLVPKDEKVINPVELSSNPALETLDGITGCRTSKDITLPVELSVPPGEYRLLIQVRYCIFIGRCIPIQGYSDYFTIGKADIPGRLSAINKELDNIKQYIQRDTTSISNSQPTRIVPEPIQPEVSPSSPVTQNQQERGILDSVIDTTRLSIDEILITLGGR